MTATALAAEQSAPKAAPSLKGSQQTWGIWERMIPGQVDPRDAAGQRMLDIHLRRYATAIPYVQGRRVLDIASGTGYGARMLKDAGAAAVLGVDLSNEAVEFARDCYAAPGVEFRQGDAQEFTADEPFDVVASFETIEHVPNPEKFLQRIHAALRPGGAFLISVPLGETRHIDSYHLHVFHEQDVYRLLGAAGFRVEASRLDDWRVGLFELLRWQKIYPESRVPVSELLGTWRGRRVLRDLVLSRSIRLPMLMVSTRRMDAPCENPIRAPQVLDVPEMQGHHHPAG